MIPLFDKIPEYYQNYIRLTGGGNLDDVLNKGWEDTIDLMLSFPADKLNYSYAEGKWTPKEIWVHSMDSERVFAYRALRFARKDSTPLQGYEHNDYVPSSKCEDRTLDSIVYEYRAVRQNSLSLFKHLPDENLDFLGEASGFPMTARALGYAIAGHELHHNNVIREKYLGIMNTEESTI